MPDTPGQRVGRLLDELRSLPAPACRNKITPIVEQLAVAVMEYSELVQNKLTEYDNVIFQLSLRVLVDKKPN